MPVLCAVCRWTGIRHHDEITTIYACISILYQRKDPQNSIHAPHDKGPKSDFDFGTYPPVLILEFPIDQTGHLLVKLTVPAITAILVSAVQHLTEL